MAVERDLLLANEALSEIGNPFQLATCGWVLGPPQDRTKFDRLLPKNIPFSCINRAQGYAPVEQSFQQLIGRPKWSIPWLEDDPAMVSTQLWVGRTRKDALDSYRYGCDGLLGIHWRTKIIGPNISALAKAAWDLNERDLSATGSLREVPVTDFYSDWIKANFGLVDSQLLNLFIGIDSKGIITKDGKPGDAPLLSSVWKGGPGSLMAANNLIDLEHRLKRYDFISKLESFAVKVQGTGSRERFNYWMNSFKFNKAQIEVAKAFVELSIIVKRIDNEKNNTRKLEIANKEAIAKRIKLAKTWAGLYEILLSVIYTNSELGTLANMEMHNMEFMGYLSKYDLKLQDTLQIKLPKRAFLSMEYADPTRVIVATNQTILSRGEDFYLRVRMLSQEKKLSGRLYYRLLGKGEFQSIPLEHMARNVFEVNIPSSKISGDFEYYIGVRAGNQYIQYPTTAGDINATVTLF